MRIQWEKIYLLVVWNSQKNVGKIVNNKVSLLNFDFVSCSDTCFTALDLVPQKNQHKTNNNGEEKREGKIKEKYFIVVQCNDFTTCSTSMIILLIFIRISFRCALGIDMTVDGWSHVDSIGRYFARIWYAASCGHVKLQVELLFYWQFPLHIISSLWPIPMCCVGCCCCCGKIEQLKERKEKKNISWNWNGIVLLFFFSVYFSHFSSLLLSHRTTTIHTNKC